MQQNNHPDKEVLETINQTPKLHNQKKNHNLTDQNPKTKNK